MDAFVTDTVGWSEQLLRLALALALGMAIGFEREWHEKAAGFRTLALVSLGSALFTTYALYVTSGQEEARLAAGVITGVGFLGAGVILRQRGEVIGLTTAAAVWTSAALGMGAAYGAYGVTIAATVAILVVLTLLQHLPISRVAEESHLIEIVADYEPGRANRIAGTLTSFGLSVETESLAREDEVFTGVWRVVGKPTSQREAIRSIMSDPEFRRVEVS